jgi:hypothetical protein
MSNKKISDLDPMSIAKNNDMLPIVDTATTAYVTKRIAVIDLKNKFMLPIGIQDVTNLRRELDNRISYNSIIDGGSY